MAIIVMGLVGIMDLIPQRVLHEIPALFIQPSDDDGAFCDLRFSVCPEV
jgi:hypothetical protein